MAKSKHTPELHFLPLGGSGEIGMNLNLYAYGPLGDQDWLMVDCGISFADIYLPGIDLIMPDVSFIEKRRDRLLGLVITHAHEDHVGAVAYLWPQLQCPIYATPFTARILQGKLQELGLEKEAVVHEVPLGGRIELGPFSIEMVALTHSILEPNALRIKTPLGSVFHTGDWKLDPDPLIGDPVDHKAMKRMGDEGVLALVCDSTNVFNTQPTGSEKAVRESLIRLLSDKKGKVFCTTFASNVVRVETLARVAEAGQRHLCLVGRSLKRYVAAAREVGYLKDFPPVIDEEEAGYLPDDKVLYICTGCQGEARAAMMRIAQDTNRHIALNAGDTVVFSSKIIPGNELVLGRLHNLLVEKGAEVITEKDAFVHVSGHPGQQELTQMYRWIRPEIAVPVHGELRHLTRQAELARDLGVGQVVVPRNGALIRLAPGEAAIIDEVEHGRVALDGQFLISDEDEAIVTRRRLMYNGGLVVSVVLDRNLELACVPEITILGLADEGDGGLERQIRRNVEDVLNRLPARALKDDSFLKEEVRIAARRAAKTYTERETGPVTVVSLSRLK
ncbi:ribonuclease J [Luteithermobacter gelatinilyticus]|uniref:ribonuclease J n=1 Tax=Luteithermobacter gelatinilyticus TaxID=2582913 RepID=UPI0011059991|nr:ribonuclease J [Luteithermobacter gelatinilyticus]